MIAIALVLFGFLYQKGQQRLLAFPTAEGGGANSVGGRGGRVIEVTNLNSKGEGSLRFACETNGTRTVVFCVGGTIDLGGKDIVIKNDNITIAGQTATGDGIQIKNGGLVVNASEVIIRYLRLRPGPARPDVDALRIASPNRHERKKNIIIDHISAFWGVDETIDSGSFNDNITIQWSIIAEGLHNSIHSEGKHSRGVVIAEDSRNITLHHNLIYRNYKRNPLIQSSDADIINNVIVNPQYQVFIQPFKGAVKANFIGNYFRSFHHKRPPIRVYDYNKGYDGISGIYYRDNYDSYFRKESNQSEKDIRILHQDKASASSEHIKDMENPYPFFSPTHESVHDAYLLVLDNVGANYPKRDSADTRVIDVVRSGVVPKTLVNHPKDVGGWPIIKGATPYLDSDHDGMPDKWEEHHGLNPNSTKDRNGKELSEVGYTNLEVYINGLVEI